MQIEIKDNLVELRKHHEQLLLYVTSNCSNPFFMNIVERMKGVNIDIRKDFGEYLYNIMYPISYKTISQPCPRSRHAPAVGKWFGRLVSTNISYFNKDNTYEGITQEHIALMSSKKQKILQDFYDFKQEYLLYSQSGDKKEYAINVNLDLYEIYRAIIDRTYYVGVNKKIPSTISIIKIEYSLSPFHIMFSILPLDTNSHFIEIYHMNSGGINSNSLKCLKENSYQSILCFDNPEIFLTNEIKSGMIEIINKAIRFQEKWNNLKMKYAHLLLQKGKI
jgi:hypothetical protein